MLKCDNLDTHHQWLRAASAHPTLALVWPAFAVFLVHLADIVSRLRHGKQAVLLPSRTGGADHSARAVLTGLSPMVFGGEAHAGAQCCTRGWVRHQPRVLLRWVTPRWRVLTLHPSQHRIARVITPSSGGTVTA